MIRWEYLVAQDLGEGDSGDLVKLGREGWELVTVVLAEGYARNHYRFYFKRRVEG